MFSTINREFLKYDHGKMLRMKRKKLVRFIHWFEDTVPDLRYILLCYSKKPRKKRLFDIRKSACSR